LSNFGPEVGIEWLYENTQLVSVIGSEVKMGDKVLIVTAILDSDKVVNTVPSFWETSPYFALEMVAEEDTTGYA
jgi:hypothetical protein